MASTPGSSFLVILSDDRSTQVGVVGGKGASLGKLVSTRDVSNWLLT